MSGVCHETLNTATKYYLLNYTIYRKIFKITIAVKDHTFYTCCSMLSHYIKFVKLALIVVLLLYYYVHCTCCSI